jgi:uncharacterized membrane protein YkvA (DUF1232 family)
LALYAFEPFNFALPLLGFVDDLILLPLVLHGLVKLFPPDISQEFARRSLLR